MTDNEIKEAVRAGIRRTLANEVCSAQCLDVAADRKRVENELMNMFTAIAATL